MNAACINYDIHKIDERLAAGMASARDMARLPKLKAKYPVALRRELKRLAQFLTYKADIYYPGVGRIYSCDGKWSVIDGPALVFTHRETKAVLTVDRNQLTDGHGQLITIEDNY
jgi:hypothetical protein